jgi:hypothetical protein
MFWNTVSSRLRETLQFLMISNEFNLFRLVGGTALSLQLGHRRSIDIDLFTDAPYGSINFDTIESFLNQKFST